jgi:hypothetical protein
VATVTTPPPAGPEAAHAQPAQGGWPQQSYAYGPQAQAAPESNKKAIWAFVLAILGFAILPIVFSTIAIILGALARSEIQQNPRQGGAGLAKAAIILGPIGIVAGIAVCALLASG